MDNGLMCHENLSKKNRRNVFSDAFAVKKQLIEVYGAAPNINHPDQLLYTCYRCYNKQLFTWYSSYNTESDWSYKIIITSLTVDVAAVSPENFKWSLSGAPRPQVDSEPLTLWGWWAISISWYGIIYLYVLYDAVHSKLKRINTYRHSRKKVVLTLRTFQCYNWEF